jgi:hypothetical protein
VWLRSRAGVTAFLLPTQYAPRNQRFRHVPAAIPIFAIAGILTAGPRQQSLWLQQPDLAYRMQKARPEFPKDPQSPVTARS